MKTSTVSYLLLAVGMCFASRLQAEELNDRVQAKLDQWIVQAKEWASDPVLIKAVSEQNAHPPAVFAGMTQEIWKNLKETDPLVYALTRNEAGQTLKAKKTAAVSEAFVSDANGLKVGFLTKPTSWSHKGKPKHDMPMSGQVWKGTIELDQSSGTRQIQISVPILEKDKPIGSLVIGMVLSDLTTK